MNARTIAWTLAIRRSSPFFVRTQLAVVPNVSWGLLPWEADLVACSKAGYLTEIEIKISFSDWKADPMKAKFRCGHRQWDMVKAFWYAAPKKLALRHAEIDGLRAGYGVLAIDCDQVEILKPAEPNRMARKLTDAERLQLCRLGAIKAWNRVYHPTVEELTAKVST